MRASFHSKNVAQQEKKFENYSLKSSAQLNLKTENLPSCNIPPLPQFFRASLNPDGNTINILQVTNQSTCCKPQGQISVHENKSGRFAYTNMQIKKGNLHTYTYKSITKNSLVELNICFIPKNNLLLNFSSHPHQTVC